VTGAFVIHHLTDDDELRRARSIMIAAAVVLVYLAGAATVDAVCGDIAAAVAAAGVVVLAAVAFAIARAGRLVVAEWATAALVAGGSLALVAMEGPVSSRLGALQIGVVVLGLAARPWMAIAAAVFAIATVESASALHLAIPLGPSTTPVWLAIVQQILLTTALMMTFTHGYGRLHDILARRTSKLEAAHVDLLAATQRLEQLVDQRTEELECATDDLDAFTSTIAHDLRAPLRHVRHHLQVFLDDAAALGEARLAPIAEVLAATAELSTTMESILATARRSPRPRAE